MELILGLAILAYSIFDTWQNQPVNPQATVKSVHPSGSCRWVLNDKGYTCREPTTLEPRITIEE